MEKFSAIIKTKLPKIIIMALYGKLFATIMMSMGFTIGNIIYSACPVRLSIEQRENVNVEARDSIDDWDNL